MTREPIRNKTQMYRELAAGAFGNTNPFYMSLAEWGRSLTAASPPLWGVRSVYSWDRRMRLDVPLAAVGELVGRWFPDGRVNLSPMVDRMLTFRAEVFEDAHGLRVYGVEGLRDVKWRQAMGAHSREWRGLAAKQLLRAHLNSNSLSDLGELLDLYPGHVMEFTALDRNYGTVPGRNAVIWEVRLY